MKLTAKFALLEQETRHCAELTKANTNLKTKLVAHREQMGQAKADTVAGFRTSQSYYDECGGYYGDGFDDCLKQVAAIYPNLDLSQVVINDTISLKPGGADTIIDQANASIHMVEEEVKELAETEVVVQNVPKGKTIPDNPIALEGLFAPEGLSASDQPLSDVPP